MKGKCTRCGEEAELAKQVKLKAGDRIVTVINPTSLTGGEIINDSTIPANKSFVGVVGGVAGLLSDVPQTK